MKVTMILCVSVLALVSAEPPKYSAPAPAAAPYPPSGWRPSGRQFSLPTREAPQTAYNAPPKEKYGPPPAVYGPPPTTTEVPTTTELPSTTEDTTEMATENPQDNEFSGDAARALTAQALAAQRSNGVYYVLLPDGRLQRVAYSTSRNSQDFQRLIATPEPVNAGFFAVQYEDVQPIQAPVYAYGSPLVRLFK